MTAAIATTPPPTLDTLAAGINEEHRACETAARSAVEHAVRAGELLAEAKGKVSHGQWLPWVREHVEFSERTVQLYMTTARRFAALDDPKAQRVADLPLREAARLLAQPAESAKDNFDERGRELRRVRDTRAYKAEGFKTFADYCRVRNQMETRQATELIDCARVVERLCASNAERLEAGELPPGHDVLPQSREVARELIPLLPKEDRRAARIIPRDGYCMYGLGGKDLVTLHPSQHAAYYYVNHFVLDHEKVDLGGAFVEGYKKPMHRDYIRAELERCVPDLSRFEWCELPCAPWDYNVAFYVSRQDHFDQGMFGKNP